MAATPVRRKSSAPDSGPSAEAYDPKLANSEAVQLGLRGAMASAVAVLLAMCALAAGVSLLIIYIVPPPGAADLAEEMPWTRLHPFRPEHDYVTGLAAAGFTVLPSGVGHLDVEESHGKPWQPGEFAMLYFKMYLAEAEVLPSSAFAAPDRFPFIYSRANDRDAVFVAAGEHSDELLPGFEEGVAGMKVLGKRKLVLPPGGAFGAAGFEFRNAMRRHVVPPNATLLFFVELAHVGRPHHHEHAHEEL